MKWKLVPTEVTHEMTSGVVLPGYDRTMDVRVFQSIVDHSAAIEAAMKSREAF